MNQPCKISRASIIIGIGIVLTGIMLFVTTLLVLVAVQQDTRETIENRRVACTGRYLDGEKFAPACREFIEEYIRGQ